MKYHSAAGNLFTSAQINTTAVCFETPILLQQAGGFLKAGAMAFELWWRLNLHGSNYKKAAEGAIQ